MEKKYINTVNETVFKSDTEQKIVLNVWNETKNDIVISVNKESYTLARGYESKEPDHIRELLVSELNIFCDLEKSLSYTIDL